MTMTNLRDGNVFQGAFGSMFIYLRMSEHVIPSVHRKLSKRTRLAALRTRRRACSISARDFAISATTVPARINCALRCPSKIQEHADHVARETCQRSCVMDLLRAVSGRQEQLGQHLWTACNGGCGPGWIKSLPNKNVILPIEFW